MIRFASILTALLFCVGGVWVPGVQGQQLLQNRSCESATGNTVDEWTELNGLSWTCNQEVPSIDGTTVFSMQTTDVTSGETKGLQEEVSVEGGTTYAFFGRLRTEGGDMGGVEVRYLDGEGTPIDSFTTGGFFSNVDSTGGTWTTKRHVEEVPEGTQAVQVQLLVDNADGSTNTEVYFDDLRLFKKTQLVEIMSAPTAVSDSEGEYVELYNSAATDVDLSSWTLNGESIGSLVISARDVAVLCANPAPEANGGIEACDNASGISLGGGQPLGDESGQLVLRDGNGLAVDSVRYGAGSDWPTPGAGSIVFADSAAGTHDGENWEAASRRERGYRLGNGGDEGSPGRIGTGQSVQPSVEVSGGAGWRMLASPVSDVSATTLAQVSLVQGISDLFPSAAPNLYQWPGGTIGSGDGSDQWVQPASATTPLSAPSTENGMGYIWYVFGTSDTPQTDTPPFALSVPGEKRTTNVTTTSLSGGSGSNSAFHLLGNPYGNTFNLSGLNLSANGFQTTVQAWDPSAGSYQDLRSGESLSAYQGFFVERMATGSASLTFDADARSSSTVGLRSDGGTGARLAFRLVGRAADGDTLTQDDAVTLRVAPEASLGWDVHDASKLTPLSSSYATAAFVGERADDTVHQAVRSVPAELPRDTVSLPIALQAVGAEGVEMFTLVWPEWNQVPGAWSLTLHDTVADTSMDLRTQSQYSFPATTVPMTARERSEGAPPSLRRPSRVGSASPSPRFVLTLTSNVVPVELAHVSAVRSGQHAELDWTTAGETNNAGFAIEHRGPDAAAFRRVGFVKGQGTTARTHSYHYRTQALSVGTHAFRLRQVDADGSEEVSRVVRVEMGMDGAYKTSLRPHPLTHSGVFRLTVKTRQRVRVSVYDLLGRRVHTLLDETVLPAYDTRTIRLQPAQMGLPSGTYLLRIDGETFSGTERLVIVR